MTRCEGGTAVSETNATAHGMATARFSLNLKCHMFRHIVLRFLSDRETVVICSRKAQAMIDSK